MLLHEFADFGMYFLEFFLLATVTLVIEKKGRI